MSTENPEVQKVDIEAVEHEAARNTEREIRGMVTEVIEMSEGNARLKRDLEHKDMNDASKTLERRFGEPHEQTQERFVEQVKENRKRSVEPSLDSAQEKAADDPMAFAVDQVIASHKEAGGEDLSERRSELLKRVHTEVDNRRTIEYGKSMQGLSEEYAQKINKENEEIGRLEATAAEIEKLTPVLTAEATELKTQTEAAEKMQQRFASYSQKTDRLLTGGTQQK